MSGPAVRWSYVARDGAWGELEVDGLGAAIAESPKLDMQQFSMLIDDSRADELLNSLCDRGCEPYDAPSRSHRLVSIAHQAAIKAGLDNSSALNWCEWFWKNDQLADEPTAFEMLTRWQRAV